MIPRLVLAAALCLLTAPVWAQGEDPWCQNLWLSRNTVMDRVGQCFSTPLGQAVFDNSDCISGARRLSPLDTEIVSQLQALEAEFGCDVDTSANRLNPQSLEWRGRLMELWTIPIRADTEHSCGGYTGPTMELHSGISTSTTRIGRLEPGHNFGFSHQRMPPDWEYITVSDADYNFVAHGWVQGIEMTDEVCTFMAG